MRPGTAIVRAPGWVLSLFALLLLLIYGLSYYEGILRNAGAVLLNRALSVDGEASTAADEAEAALTLAVEVPDAERATWRLFGFAMAANGKEVAAEGAWRTAGDMVDEFITFGQRARTAGNYEASLIWFGRGRVLLPERGDWSYFEGVTLREAGRPAEALEACRQALGAALVEVGVSDVYLEIGRILATEIEPPDLTVAHRALNRAVVEDQFEQASQVTALYYRGDTRRRLGMIEQAISDYERVLQETPDDYLANMRLGTLLWQERGRAKEAERLLTRAIALDPEVKWAYRSLAELLQETGRDGEALSHYERVLELDPRDPVAKREVDRLSRSGTER